MGARKAPIENGAVPVAQERRQETDALIPKERKLHLVSAVSFTVATLCALVGVIASTDGMKLGFSTFLLALCAANAVAQYVLYFKKKE